ncbi:MAG: trigger factor [Candidatus Terrybacteria bacterium RIFCSPHIGHO2_01_FULL_48_17]|uniref:Trigger factor n=1 Tax=Candidatus Terrybacteria bacterium RIFCSPHIGHO2_01_FULL_48_17 TaxID=1802362 RepID=A0A1G2PJD6_9BACT|nr:MAG: trigger factor [Candidatus Terrybacteria bacterium RIFCSPHIGHO2_01_FULL_48_17]
MDIRENHSKNTLVFLITLEQNEMGVHESEALGMLAQKLDVPGFRKGNVPPHIARQHIRPEALFSKTVEIAAGHAAAKVLAPHIDTMVGPPRISIIKAAAASPLEARIEADLLPEIDLKDWKKLRIEQKAVVVDAKEIDGSLQWLRKSRAQYRAVTRPAQMGDFVELAFRVTVDGKELSEANSERYPLILGEGSFVPGFEDKVVGMRGNDERTFGIAVPQEWPHPLLAGKAVTFTVKLLTLHERLLPELNDDFARSLGKLEDLETLRQNVREGLEREHQDKEKRRVKADALKELSRKVKEPIPEALVAQEVENLWQDFSNSILAGGMPVSDYLLRIGKSPEELKKELRVPALERAKAALVMRAIAHAEAIRASDGEIEGEAAKLLKGANAPTLEGKVDPSELRAYAEARVRNEKVLQLIYDVVTQDTRHKTQDTNNFQ